MTIAAAGPVSTDPLAGLLPGTAECTPSAGVGVVSPANPSKPRPNDSNVSIYSGGNFTVLRGTEVEGQLVVNGDATFNSPLNYGVGFVGGGSGLIPKVGSDVIRVGGNLASNYTATDTNGVTGQAVDAAGNEAEANIRVGGTVTGKVGVTGDGEISKGIGAEAALGDPYANWPDNDFEILKDFATRNLTAPGTVEGDSSVAWGDFNISGKPGAQRHLFEVEEGALSKKFVLQLSTANISPTDPIVISVAGEVATVNLDNIFIDGVMIDDSKMRFGQLASQILWVFPNAKTVNISGLGQLPGSILVPTSGSTTTNASPGTNGRVWVAGNLVQDYAGGEFHNFPFIGDPDLLCFPPGTPPSAAVVTPVAPTVVQATCDYLGDASEPSITLAETDGITYTTTDNVTAGETVTITATATKENPFPAQVDGWTVSEDRLTATKKITLETVDCDAPVIPGVATPVAPTVTESICEVPGEPTTPSVVLPDNTDDVTYSKTGDETQGSTVTVTAKAEEGFLFPAQVDGWTVSEDRLTATTTIELTTIDCELPTVSSKPVPPSTQVPPSKPVPPSTPELPATGASGTFVLFGASVLLLAAGAAFLVRRRITS